MESEQRQPEEERGKKGREQIYQQNNQQRSMFGSSSIQVSDTQVHNGLHKLHPKLTHYIMYYFTKSDIDCLGTHYIIKNSYVRLSYFSH